MIPEVLRDSRNVYPMLSTIVGLLLLSMCLSYAITHYKDFQLLRKISTLEFTSVYFLSMFSWVAYAWCNAVLYSVLGIKLRFKEWFSLTMMTTFANLFVPAGTGMGAKAIYLKQKHALGYSYFISLSSGLLLLTMLVNAVIGLSSCLILNLFYNVSSVPLTILLSGILVGGFLLILLPGNICLSNRKPFNRLEHLIKGWESFASHRGAQIRISAVTVVRLALLSIIYYLVFSAMNVDAEWLSCWIVASFGTIARLVNITPGSIGIYEYSVGLSAEAFGIPLAAGVTVALVHRAISVLIVLPFGALSILLLWWNRNDRGSEPPG